MPLMENKDEKNHVLEAVALVLGEGVDHPEVEKVFLRNATEAGSGVRRISCQFLARVPHRKALVVLTGIVEKDGDWRVEKAAALSIVSINAYLQSIAHH